MTQLKGGEKAGGNLEKGGVEPPHTHTTRSTVSNKRLAKYMASAPAESRVSTRKHARCKLRSRLRSSTLPQEAQHFQLRHRLRIDATKTLRSRLKRVSLLRRAHPWLKKCLPSLFSLTPQPMMNDDLSSRTQRLTDRRSSY